VAIDNPLDQAQAQLAAEERDRSLALGVLASASIFVRAFRALTTAVASGNPAELLDTLKGYAESRAAENVRYLLEIVISEVRAQSERFSELDRRQQEYLDRDWPGLLLDTERKARATRAQEKVGRLARIVSSAAFEDPPAPPDRTEELLRIATNLDELDVRILTVLVNGQRLGFTPEFGRVNDDAANNYWGHGDSLYHGGPGAVTKQFGESAISTRLGVSEGELQSVCAKLQSFGLVIPVERNQFTNFKGTVPYAVLARGIEFVDAIRSHVASELNEGKS